MADSLGNAGEHIRLEYVPRAGLGRLAIVNFLLNVVTLTIYRFWAKTNVRKHIWSCVHINGQPLEYTGRGIELFKGALIVFGLFVLPFVLVATFINIALGPEHPALFALYGLLYLFIFLLWGAALYRARRYQLSRTLWRGIRGTLVGSSMIYSLTYFGAMLARAMSLGWTTPVLNTVLQEQIIGDMRFGDLAFKFKGRAGPLYPTYALCWFLSLLALIVFAFLFGAEVVALFGPEVQKVFDDIFKPDSEPTSDQIWTASTVIAISCFLIPGNVPGHSHAVGNLLGEGTFDFCHLHAGGQRHVQIERHGGQPDFAGRCQSAHSHIHAWHRPALHAAAPDPLHV